MFEPIRGFTSLQRTPQADLKLGTVLAFMMSVIALSLPEMIILRKVLSLKLIAVFVGVVGTGILAVGFLVNALFN